MVDVFGKGPPHTTNAPVVAANLEGRSPFPTASVSRTDTLLATRLAFDMCSTTAAAEGRANSVPAVASSGSSRGCSATASTRCVDQSAEETEHVLIARPHTPEVRRSVCLRVPSVLLVPATPAPAPRLDGAASLDRDNAVGRASFMTEGGDDVDLLLSWQPRLSLLGRDSAAQPARAYSSPPRTSMRLSGCVFAPSRDPVSALTRFGVVEPEPASSEHEVFARPQFYEAQRTSCSVASCVVPESSTTPSLRADSAVSPVGERAASGATFHKSDADDTLSSQPRAPRRHCELPSFSQLPRLSSAERAMLGINDAAGSPQS